MVATLRRRLAGVTVPTALSMAFESTFANETVRLSDREVVDD